VLDPTDYPKEVLSGGSSRDDDCAICLLETKRALPILPSGMNFRFITGKATETGCLFLERAGGRMNIMNLVKLTSGCAPITVEQIGMALGKTPQQIQRLRQKAFELNRLDEIFTPA
jgi:hypothetical protein